MDSFLFCFFPCLCFLPRPLHKELLRAALQQRRRLISCFPYFLSLLPPLTFFQTSASSSLRPSERLLDLDDCEAGLCRKRPSGRKLQRGQDEPFLQNGHIKCPSQEVPARGGERIRYLFFCMTATAVVGITGVMLLTTCGIGATYACTFLFFFSDVKQCCTNNNYH